MKLTGWVTGAIVAGGVVFAMRGGCLNRSSSAPDERFAGRLDDMCQIARKNIKTPETGLRRLGAYLDKHTGDMLGEWGDTLAAIERIPDDARHDDRARLARDRIRKPVLACAGDWNRFFNAVEADPAAKALFEHFAERLGRTLEIIGSGGTLRDLPGALDQAIERL
ncbi:MAG TPA: hypothetical protein VFS15_03380 [Kofleriaceae bacterium]|nr:hypothetical protein [Kofleriaceae bacterium]